MDDPLNPGHREELVWSLRWLAAEPEAALAAVRGVVTADEIALDIGHWLEVARDWDLLEEPVRGLVTEIDAQFRAMSEPGNADKWTDEAVAASAEWATQRERARTALALLGESRADGELGSSRPGGPTYIPGGIRSDDGDDIPGHLATPRANTVIHVTDDFSPEWDAFAGLALARDELRTIRNTVWARALLPTTEILHVDRIRPEQRGWSVDAAGDVMLFEVSVVTTMPDRHDIESSVRLLLSNDGWRVETEVNMLNDAVTVLWEGSAATGTSRSDMGPALVAGAREVVKATLALDALAAPPVK